MLLFKICDRFWHKKFNYKIWISVANVDEVIFYSVAEKNCRQLTQLVVIGYSLMSIGLFTVAALYPLYCMQMGNFDTSTWLLPYSLTVPFDTSTIFGWYLFWLVQFYIAIVYAISVACATTYFGSNCLYIIAICEHFDFLIDSIDSDVEMANLNSETFPEHESHSLNVIRLKCKITKTVELQSKIYE